MTGKKNYKTLLIEARNLRSEAGLSAYKRIVLLVSVFNDQEFRADIGATDDFGAAEILDAEVEDLCLSFLQLRSMYETFPDVEEWKDGKLRTLYDRTLESAKASKPEREPRVVNRITKAEYNQLESERQDVVAKLEYKNKLLEDTKQDVDTLRAENRELRCENERLKGRIEELEKLIKPQVA